MAVLSKLVEDFESFLEEKGINNLAASFIVGFIFVNFSLLWHEIGHVIVSRASGCEAGIQELYIMTGVSGVGECPKEKLTYIYLAGPIFALVLGLWCWYAEGENSLLRVLGLISLYYSTLPSLLPIIPYSDMWNATRYGLDPLAGWLIWVITFSYVMLLTIREVKEKRWPFG